MFLLISKLIKSQERQADLTDNIPEDIETLCLNVSR